MGGDKGYDSKVDTWMVGCVCFEMVVGIAPFYNPDIMSKRETDYKSKLANHNVSKEAQNLMDMLLQKDPEKRMPVKNVQYHPWIVNYLTDEEKMKLKAHLEKKRMDSVTKGRK